MKSIRTEPLNHAAEGDERIRTAVPAPGADSVYEDLARAVVADKAAPPVLLLAAWHYLYGWRTDDLPRLVAEAA